MKRKEFIREYIGGLRRCAPNPPYHTSMLLMDEWVDIS